MPVLSAKMARKEPISQTDDFPFISYPLIVGEYYTCYMIRYSTRTGSSSRFHIQTKDDREQCSWYSMMNELASLEKEVIKNLKPGTPCLVFDDEKLRFARGLVNKVSGQSCKIYYVDFGHVEEKFRGDIFTLPEKFIEIPALAYDCEADEDDSAIQLKDLDENDEIQCEIITGQPPYKVKINLTKTDTRYKKISVDIDKDYVVSITKVKNPFDFHVRLAKDEKKFALLEAKLQVDYEEDKGQEFKVKAGDACCVWHEGDKKWLRAEIESVQEGTCMVKFVDLGIREEFDIVGEYFRAISQEDLEWLPALAIRCCLAQIPKGPKIFKSKEAVDLFLDLICRQNLSAHVFELQEGVAQVSLTNITTNVCINDQIKEKLVASAFNCIIPKPEIGRIEDIFVTYCESIRRFYGQLTKINMDVLNNLQSELEKYGQSLADSQRVFVKENTGRIGDFCCARYSLDNLYYRGKVVSRTKAEVDVHFVDYGNTEKIKGCDVKVLTSALAATPQMGIMCSCIQSRSYNSDTDEIKKAILNQNLEVEIIGEVDGQVYEVAFTDSEKNASIRKFLALNKEPVLRPKIEVAPQRPILQFKLPKHASTEKVELVYLSNWKYLYFHLSKNKADVDRIARDIEIEVLCNPKSRELESFGPGRPCLALFSLDQCWYRAAYMSLAPDDHVKVEFVDYGNRETVPFTDVRPIPASLMELPRQVFRCTLYNFPDITIPEEIMAEFEKEALNKTFVVEFIDEGIEKSEAVQVKFIDQFGSSLIAKYTEETMSRCYSNSDYKNRGYQHYNGDQDRGKSSEGVPSESLQNGGIGSRPPSTYRTSSTDSDGQRSGFRSRYDDGRHNPRRSDNDNVWNDSSHWNQQTENGHRPTSRFREVTDHSGNSSRQENNHESRDVNGDWKSSRNDRGGGIYPRRQNDNKSGNVELGRDGYVREIPPRFRSSVGSGENDRRSESGGEGERKYNSRQFYPKDDSRTAGNNERSYDRGNGDWKRDNNKSWNGDSRKTDNYERRPRKYSNSNDDNSKPKNSWSSPKEETKILTKPELGQCSVEIGDYKKISVTYVVNPDEFYCNLFDHVSNDRYLEMSEKLNTKCRDGYSLQNMSSCSVGALCCACYSVDEEWYRARVVSVSGNDAEVFFIDYGNTDQCQVSALKFLTDEFQALPARAIKCSLCDIRSGCGEPWTLDEATHFENEVTQTIFLGHFKSKEASGAYVVDLIDSSILNDLSLRYKLMAERDFRPKLTTDALYMEATSRSLHLNPYPKIKFNFDKAFTAYVAWINTPGEFYGQLVEKEALWQDFELKLNSFYESKGENELVLSERRRGTPCVAPYTVSGIKGWYRAFIIAEDAEQSLVHYVDYGNTGLVAASEMKLVDPEFLDHPAQAILFSVNGIRPLGAQWEKVSQERLAKYYSGDLECTVVKCADDKYIVDVVARGKNVATELINGGFACPGDDFTLTVAPLVKKLACKLMSVEPEPLEHIGLPVDIFKATAATCSRSAFEVGKPGPSTSAIPSTSSEQLPVSAKSEAKELCVGDCFIALVSVVNAANDFWIQHIAKADDLDNLAAILLATYNDTDPEEMLNLSPGDMCVARYSVDGNWYRAKVLGERDFGLTLLFVDYGNIEWVSLDVVRVMPQPSIEWVSEAPYAFACSLDGLPSFQNDVCPDNVNESFNTVLESGNHVVEVTITKRIGDKLFVKMKCHGVNVASVVAEECNLSLVAVEPTVTQFPVPEYKLKTILNGSISYCESPSKFWIQATDDAEKLAQLFEDLTGCSESADDLPSQNIKSGSVVLAFYHVDDCWYRAIVNEVSEASANIKFVDYGNSDDVQLVSLKTLPEKFINVPLMAIECTLHGVKRPEQGWCTDELDLFKSLEAQGNVLQLEIVDIVTGVYSVVLRDDDNNYNEMLSSQQQPAVPLDITVDVSTPTLHLGMIDFKLGEKVEAFISHIISPSEFWIQRSSDLDKIDNISDELNESCVAATGGHSSEMKFTVGEVCAVQFTLDDSWYRGQLLEEKDDGFLAHFVDFGNREVVSIERILKLDKFELMHLPFYAIKCELGGGDSCIEWPEEAIETFKSDYDNKTCLAEFVSKKSQSYVINLLDMGINVAKKLLGDKWRQIETEPNPDSSSEVQNSVEVIRVESEESIGSSTGLYSTEVFGRSEEQIGESNDQEADLSEVVSNVEEGAEVNKEDVATEIESKSEDQEADLSDVLSNVEEGAEVNTEDVATEIELKSEDQEADLSEVVSNVEEEAKVNKEGVATEIESISQNNSSNDASKDVSTEGFTSHLTIPTYSEFVEYAASHPGSVSQSPDSSMDRGNGSSNEDDIITSTDVESSSDANSNGQQQWEVTSSTDAESKSFQEDPEDSNLSTTGDAAKAIFLIERSTEVSETTDFETEDASSCVDTDGDKSGQPISDDAESAEGVFTGIPTLSITAAVEEESDCSSGQAADASAEEVEDGEDGEENGLPEAVLEAALLVPLQGDNSWSEGESDDSATIKNSSFEVDSKDGKMAKDSIPSTETNADLNH